MKREIWHVARFASGAILFAAAISLSYASSLEILSVGVGNTPADGASSTMFFHSMSDDGRYVLFRSFATNLRSQPDTNNQADIYLRDRLLETTELISVDSSGTLGLDSSDFGAMTPDARYVAFQTANTYVLPDDNFASDVFVRDRLLGTTVRVTVNSHGDQAEPLYAVSGLPDISADGRYVVFYSRAENLVDNDTNGTGDIFVRDVQLGMTSRVSVGSQGTEANGESVDSRISADGRYVVFKSMATNLVGGSGSEEIYVRDLLNQTTKLASTSTSGEPANDGSFGPQISDDDRYVIFASFATNLVASPVTHGQIYRHDLQTGVTTLVSTNSAGEPGDSFSQEAVPFANGRYIVFQSDATNLVPGDTNGKWDIFWHDCDTGVTRRLSVDALGAQGFEDSEIPSIANGGEYIAFESQATNWFLNGGIYDPQGYNVFIAPVSLFSDGFEN